MTEDPPAVTVYRRPGCPYCVALVAGLKVRGVPFASIDVWQDPEASAFVRAQSGGNETVPVVVVGDRVLVNPGARAVARLVDGG